MTIQDIEEHSLPTLNLPDPEIVKTYERVVEQNALAAVNNKIFFGYWSVCADSQEFGYGNT